MELGRRIAEIRKENDLTQEGLAEICSVTRQTISNWENGKSYPDLETLVLISDTFDVSLDALLKGDRKMVSEITKEQKHGKRGFIKIAAAVLIAAIVVTGILCVKNYVGYLPYEKSGLSITDDGKLYTDIKIKGSYTLGTMINIENNRIYDVNFIFFTGGVGAKYFDRKNDENRMFNDFLGRSSRSDTVELVVEVYYLPEKYVKEYDLIDNFSSFTILQGPPSEERDKLIEQLKADSILIWKSE